MRSGRTIRRKALMHGPTFMANALACAAANASLDLFEREPRLDQVATISAALRDGLEPCRRLPGVKDVRVKGAIGVVELDRIENLNALRQRFITEGVFIRPFGSVVYLTPAFTIAHDELAGLMEAVRHAVAAHGVIPIMKTLSGNTSCAPEFIRGFARSDTEMVVHNSSRKTTAISAVAGVILLAGMNAGSAASGKHATTARAAHKLNRCRRACTTCRQKRSLAANAARHMVTILVANHRAVQIVGVGALDLHGGDLADAQRPAA